MAIHFKGQNKYFEEYADLSKECVSNAYCFIIDKEHYWIESYKNRVIDEFEVNQCNDSDFCATVIDENGYATTIIYSSTCFFCDNFAVVDVNPKEALKAYRKSRNRELLEKRAKEQKEAEKMGVKRWQMRMIENVYDSPWMVKVIFDLLKAYKHGKMRSEFKKSLAKQVHAWFEEQTYKFPLSQRQIECLKYEGF